MSQSYVNLVMVDCIDVIEIWSHISVENGIRPLCIVEVIKGSEPHIHTTVGSE